MKRFRIRGKGGVLAEGVLFRDGQVIIRLKPVGELAPEGTRSSETTGKQNKGQIKELNSMTSLAIFTQDNFKEANTEWIDTTNSDWLGLAETIEEFNARHDQRGGSHIKE